MISRNLNKINKIIIHCSDSDVEAHDNVQTIRVWHLARGFEDIGYHYIIMKHTEDIGYGRHIGYVGAHCKGYNYNSIGICLTGKTQFTKLQFTGVVSLI